MTVNNQVETQEQAAPAANDKEYNFAQIRKTLEQEREDKIHLQRKLQEMEGLVKDLQTRRVEPEDDIDEGDYIDKKRLEKKFSSFEKNIDEKIDKKAEEKAMRMVEEMQKQSWLEQNPDFYEVMNHAQRFAEKSPAIAKAILKMPESFERNKLVYENIKLLNLHKPEEPKSNIQDKVDQNKRNPYYIPGSPGSPPYGQYAGGREYSETDQKNAYQKMKQLQKTLRLG